VTPIRKHLKWLWTFLALSGVFYGVVALAFVFLPPGRQVTEALLCHPDEHLVTETQVTTGTASGSETRGCCAKKTDTRAFGKCDWSDSLSRDSLTLLVPMGISLVIGMFLGAIATTMLALVLRNRRSGAS
jgi:hypothetical protein